MEKKKKKTLLFQAINSKGNAKLQRNFLKKRNNVFFQQYIYLIEVDKVVEIF